MSRVRDFHARFGQGDPGFPPLRPDAEMVRFRARLIREEYEEVMTELSRLTKAEDPDAIVAILRNVVQEIVDLCYVAEGTAVALGLPFDEAYEIIHASNMSKTPHPDGGKPRKGPGFVPADLRRIVPDIITQIPEEDQPHEDA